MFMSIPETISEFPQFSGSISSLSVSTTHPTMILRPLL